MISDEQLEEWERQTKTWLVCTGNFVIPEEDARSLQENHLKLVQALRTERTYRRELEEACEFYANDENWKSPKQDGPFTLDVFIIPACESLKGAKAKEALAKKPKELD